MSRLPTLFVPHGGGPCFFMDWNPRDTWDGMADYLRGLITDLPERPRALLVISAHWEAALPTVQTAPMPSMLFDYSGFPPHTYALRWPAPGSPALAARVRALLSASGIASAEDPDRGFDHGTFIPMLLSVPQADIPTIQLSLRAGLDPAEHLAVGKALAPLRDEGVLIIGSGMSFHNLRAFGPQGAVASARFDAWLTTAVQQPEQLAAWSSAPSAREAHPREEHLLPLMVAAGAAAGDVGIVPYREQVMGMTLSAVQFG